MPAKGNVKAWRAIRSSLGEASAEVAVITQRIRVRKIHQLEKEIERFEAMPKCERWVEQKGRSRSPALLSNEWSGPYLADGDAVRHRTRISRQGGPAAAVVLVDRGGADVGHIEVAAGVASQIVGHHARESSVDVSGGKDL